MTELALAAARTVGPCRVALLADVRLYRDGLTRVLAATPELEMVGAAPIDEAGLAFLRTERPDVVLLEVASARTPAIVQGILAVVPDAKVIAFAIGDDEQDAILCAEAGVAGFVSREASIEELVSTILRVAQGEFPCSPRIAAVFVRRISWLAAQREPDRAIARLTAREHEVLGLIDQGSSNKEIARRLGIGVSTVKNHVHNILHKTSASRRSQAAARVRPTWIGRSMPAPERI